MSKLKFILSVIVIACHLKCFYQHSTKIPELEDESQCTPGQIFKIKCNTCECLQPGHALCTKMSCFDKKKIGLLKHKRLQKLSLRGANGNMPSQPPVPKDDCVPGKLYNNGCDLCYCDKQGTVTCVEQPCDKKSLRESKALRVEAIIRSLGKTEFDSLPVLAHSASKCEPGVSYKVDCNGCLCLADGNLLCDKMLCLNQDDSNKDEASKMSGKECKNPEVVVSKCITCLCVDKVMRCDAVPGCVSDYKRLRLNINLNIEDECIPGSVYKLECNRCYCQEDGELRCTQKTCLNYTQTQDLIKSSHLFLNASRENEL